MPLSTMIAGTRKSGSLRGALCSSWSGCCGVAVADITLGRWFLFKSLRQPVKRRRPEQVRDVGCADPMNMEPLSQPGGIWTLARRCAEARLPNFAPAGMPALVGAGAAPGTAEAGVVLFPQRMTAEAWSAHAQAYYRHLDKDGEC